MFTEPRTFGKIKEFFIKRLGKKTVAIDWAAPNGDRSVEITGYWLNGKLYITELKEL